MKRFLRQLYFELLKLFARKRTYLGYIAFPAIEVLILLLLQTPHARRMFTRAMTQHGLDLTHYFSGLTLAYEIMSNSVFLLGSLYVALVCGDIVAKEVEDGTMRMVLSRPVSRERVLLLKWIVCVFYTWTLMLFIVGSSLLLGIADRGLGGLVVASPWEHVFGFYEAGPGLQRFALGTLALCLAMPTLSCLGFMFSCFNVKPATATVLTLSVFIFDTILRNVPYFEGLQSYFLTHHMAVWMQMFKPQIPWADIGRSFLYLSAFDLVFLGVGTLYFRRRDFKS